jgi:two-component system, NarL family, sensor kinase
MQSTLQRSLTLRSMLVWVAVAPLVLALIAVVWVVRYQFDHLAQTQNSLMQPLLLQARKDELRHFVQLGRRAMTQIQSNSVSAVPATQEALSMLRRMDFGDDSYFFVYDLAGNNLMHPRLPNLEGLNHWDMQDSAGSLIIQRLIAQAVRGGGFVEYMWHRPSTDRDERKLGYVELVPELGWMIGTGLYLDPLQEAQTLVAQSTASAMANTRNQVVWIATAALLLVTLGGLLLSLREQRSADAKLRVMAHRVVRSQEDERTRVSRELHDGISQMLVAVKFSLEASLLQIEKNHPAVIYSLKKSMMMLTNVMKDVNRISHNLRPSILDDLDLNGAIKQIAREFTERTGVPMDVKISTIPSISEAVATALFRVTQEAMANIEKHAEAKQVHLQLDFANSTLKLSIRDDGKGFDINEASRQSRSGLGLMNMRERVEMLKGQYALESSDDGTSLQVEIPVGPSAPTVSMSER